LGGHKSEPKQQVRTPSMNSKIRAYESSSTLGLSQLDLLLKIYDGAIGCYKAAGVLYRQNKSTQAYEQLEKAKRFITHLYTTLDPDKGGDIADKLGKIYAYLLNQTNLAQATKELKILDDNITVLNNIREGWQYLKKQQQAEKSAENTAIDSGTPRKFSSSA